MLPVLSAQQMRAFDRHASEVHGVPSLELMENAGRGAAEGIQRLLPPEQAKSATVVIVAGAGNNGGDGFVVARRLLGSGVKTKTFLALSPDLLTGDALSNYRALIDAGAKVTELDGDTSELVSALETADILVDALFGTGLAREITGALAQIVEVMNAARCRKVSLDLPSGLEADTGRVLGVAVRADYTFTFAHPKLALCTPRGAAYAGKVEVCDIVEPRDPTATGASARISEAADILRLLPPRQSTVHKSSAGRVLIVGGSPGKLGAALLSAHGAQRAGAGLVTIATAPEAAGALDGRVLEAMTARLDTPGALERALERCDSCVVGPGLGLDEAARSLVDAVVFGGAPCTVVDADAISHFAGRAGELKRAPCLVLTPHAGELGRLLGVPYEEVDDDRFGAVARAVELTGAVVLLKGRFSIVGAPGSLPVINPTGGPVLATGGSGDVLAGIIAALACELSPGEAAFVGAYLHGAAADLWAHERGADRGLLAHEIGDELPRALGELRLLVAQ